MDNILYVNSIAEYNDLLGLKTLNPLVTVIDFSKINPPRKPPSTKMNFGLYMIALKEVKCGDVKYGRNYYDYQEGTLMFVAPDQVLTFDAKIKNPAAKGRTLLFHPDLIRGTSLSHNIKKYSFFSYESHEALHLSENERQIVLDCFSKIDSELIHSIDKHSKTLISTYIELLLNYSVRFYDRQFITRTNVNHDIIAGFEKQLDDYFQSELPQTIGLPTVRFFADKLHLSPNYFGDLIKKETGNSPLDHIQLKLINLARERMFDTGKTVSEIAYGLGFKNPQHFSRLFKSIAGTTPLKFRSMN
jgi:AraC-like DNA-binding protein